MYFIIFFHFLLDIYALKVDVVHGCSTLFGKRP